jgi:hypothetical protein
MERPKVRHPQLEGTSAAVPQEPSVLPTAFPRVATAALVSVLLCLGLAACGGSGPKASAERSSSTAGATTSGSTTSPQTSTTSPKTSTTSPQTTTALSTKKHPTSKPPHKRPHSSTSGAGGVSPTRSPSGSSPKTTTTSSPTKSTRSSTSGSAAKRQGGGSATESKGGGSSTKSKAGGSSPAPPLPGPVVSVSAGKMHASLHGANHAPTAGKLWGYSVLATDASGNPLSGAVDTEFVFGAAVVGHEAPPTHPLRHGRLDDRVTFPAQAVGVPLTFRVVVHTGLGSITLNWAVKARH